MRREKTYNSSTILFYIQFLSLLVFINSLSFFILKEAKENENSISKNTLQFSINGGVDESFSEDKFFKIKTEIYKDYNLLTSKNAECTIPRSPQAEFGTTIIAKCEIDLSSVQNPNKIKFKEFNTNDNDNLQVKDLKNYVLEQSLSFTKKIEIKPDIEFTAESIKPIKCIDNKIIFEIIGEMKNLFIDSFTFNLPLKENSQIKAKCLCPDIYYKASVSINCTITVINDQEFLDNLINGVEIKESYYQVTNSKFEEKSFKIGIKDNNAKIELKDFECYSNKNAQNEINNSEEYSNRKSNRGVQNQNNKNEDDYNQRREEIEENQRRREREEEEEERRRRKEEEEREKKREEERKKIAQENLEKFLRDRNKIQQNRKYDDDNNNQNNNIGQRNYNNDNYNNQQNRNYDDEIDYNSNVKLVHLQVRYSYGFIYYMFYALTPVPLGHKIKASFSITKYNYNSGYNDLETKYVILKTEEQISPNDKNIIVEYVARYDCDQCKKIILDKNSIKGAKVYNIPDDIYFLDAVAINQNNYLTKSKIQNPPLYIVENIYSQNCNIYLGGNFFNQNKFFASKFALNLIGAGYYGNSKNITVYCGLNERGSFYCPINENLNNFEYKVQQFIIDQKENIIIDNSYIAREGITNQVTCQVGNNINNNLMNNNDKSNETIDGQKTFTWKRLFIGIFIIIILYYVISKFCCPKEEEQYNDDYNPRWRVSSSNYGGETYGLRSRGW